MRFLIPINEPDPGNGSQTVDVVETGSNSPRTNRRKLTEYFRARGVKSNEMKRVFKAMGFTKETMKGS
mgnify:CR=1 FL=1